MLSFGIVIAFGVLSLLIALLLSVSVIKRNPGNETMVKISRAIQDGASAFLIEEYKTMLIWIIIFAIVIWLVVSVYVAISFIIGTLLSISAGYLGMTIATRANGRAAQAARTSIGEALKIAFSGGSVMGLTVTGLGVLGSIAIYLFASHFLKNQNPLVIVTGYSMGASFVALFARVGGGIYTKAADVGADLVGKIEAGIPEDDPRNPAVIADNVGDNVGDIAGMGADLYESYVGSILSGIILGSLAFGLSGVKFVYLVAGYGILSSVIGVLFVLFISRGKVNPQKALNIGTIVANVIAVLFTLWLSVTVLHTVRAFIAIFAGLLVGLAIGFITQYYTSGKPVRIIAKSSSEGGAATTILSGMAVGLQSTFLPLVLIGIGVVIAYISSGLYGIALAGIGMLATLGINLSVDAYGPIADNAGGIAEMSGLPEEVRERTDVLDALGNTTAAMGKGFAIGSAALTALALFSSYANAVKLSTMNMLSPYVMAGALIGGSLPFLFSSFSIMAVSSTAGLMVEEVRRQFHEIPGLMAGKAEPDYKRCVAISTRGALKNMALPSAIAVVAPFATLFAFWKFGKAALGGLLVGALIGGVLLAIFMANAGASWDNAKKYIEQGNFGGKGSEAHRASVVGDTVGDPLKDTAGPSLNILIKLMVTVSLLFAPVLMRFL